MTHYINGIGIVRAEEYPVLRRHVYKMRRVTNRTKWFRDAPPIGWVPQQYATTYYFDDVLANLGPLGSEWVIVGKILYRVGWLLETHTHPLVPGTTYSVE